MRKFYIFKMLILLQSFSLFSGAFADTGENIVTETSAPLQAELVVYVLSQEKSIRHNPDDDLIIGLVAEDNNSAFAHEMSTEFERVCAAGIEGRKCFTRNYFIADFHELNFLVEIAAQDGIKALYFADFPNPKELTDVSETTNRYNIISIGRKLDWVQSGFTYGVFMRNNIPQIYMNSDSLRNSNFTFDAGLLRLGEFLK